jgi:predicted unusual protein kinase regulating ubiquinone biosynthesis (AarF/ABC1/UbiB family)
VKRQPDIDQKRFTTVRNFFIRTFLHVIFWDIFMNRPLLRWFRRQSTRRWQKISRDYRHLAIEMGGVLIKLGQFLSVRVDILPPEVTNELIGLRDELPAAAIDTIIPQIEDDFNQPVAELFEYIDPKPLGAASLGQVHMARLTVTHEEVVIKVLRPGIDVLVETDLAAIAIAIGWLKRFKKVARRVNLDWLIEEFTTVTRNELDFAAEGKNAEQFSRDFANDPQVYIPKVYWNHSAARTLTLENVGYIRIADSAAMKAVGINPKSVAKKIYNFYLRQIFQTHFIHADPHPGNIFVRPVPTEEERAGGILSYGPGDPVEYSPDRSYQIVFVDFGMVTHIPERLRVALREYAIGIGSRDAHRIVQSYVQAGTLLPGADLKRLEEAHRAILNTFWGADASQMKDLVFSEASSMMNEYRDIIYDAPFQFQVDMLFAVRAVAILSGIATELDEKFDPWKEVIPFAERLATEELTRNWQKYIKDVISLAQTFYTLPKRLDTVVQQAEQGNLLIKTSLSRDNRNILLRLTRAINRLSWTILSVGLMISGILLGGQYHKTELTLLFMVMSLASFVWGSWRSGR